MEGLRSEIFSSWPSLFFTALFFPLIWAVFPLSSGSYFELIRTSYSFENRKSNLFLLLISPWTQIKQLNPYVSLPNLLFVGIKQSNKLSFSKLYNINLKTIKSRLSCLTCCDLWHKNKLHIDYYSDRKSVV